MTEHFSANITTTTVFRPTEGPDKDRVLIYYRGVSMLSKEQGCYGILTLSQEDAKKLAEGLVR